MDDTFDDFRNKVKIGYGAVVGKLITLQVKFFEKGSYKCMFEGKWKFVFREGKINKIGDRNEKRR